MCGITARKATGNAYAEKGLFDPGPAPTPVSTTALTAVPTAAPTSAPTEAPTAAPTATPNPVPKTGDSANPVLWLGLILLGLAGISGLAVNKVRK